VVHTLARRAEIPVEQTWDLASVYPSDDAWAAAYATAQTALPTVANYQSRLGESPTTLLAALQARDALRVAAGRLYQYAAMQVKADGGDQAAAGRLQQATGLAARLDETLAYFDPELLALDPMQVQALLTSDANLAVYAHYFDTLRRRRAHILPAEVERVVAAAGHLAAVPYRTYETLVNAELAFGAVPDGAGGSVEVASGNIGTLLSNPQRAVRQAAWEAYADGHRRLQGTLAHTLAGAVQRDVFYAGARNYPDALAAALDAGFLAPEVFHNLIATCRRHLPLWHRYWEIRRRALGVDTLRGYDIDVPLVRGLRPFPYAAACELILAGLEPLGAVYVEPLRQGLYAERWVDWAANRGKLAGAESSGSYGTRPFLLLSYDGSLDSVSGLAHEIGHSMHSYFTWRHQPPIYGDYAPFVGETASNFNQALVRAYLLDRATDADFELEVLAEALANFHRYLFLMPILAQFEQDCHARVGRGAGLTADGMSARMAELFAEGYGPAVTLDGPRVGITWAEFPHLYLNFYVYQYGLGLAAATALADTVRREGPPAAARYLRFLQAGNSVYPLETFELAGLDMTTPEPVERAFGVLAGMIDRLDVLVGAGPLRPAG